MITTPLGRLDRLLIHCLGATSDYSQAIMREEQPEPSLKTSSFLLMARMQSFGSRYFSHLGVNHVVSSRRTGLQFRNGVNRVDGTACLDAPRSQVPAFPRQD